MIRVTSTNKPARIAATAYAYVVTDEEHTYDQIIDTALCALREDRSSLWGFGVEGDMFLRSSGQPYPPGNYTVFAYRD